MKKLIICTTLIFLLLVPFIKYAHAKTLWKWVTDCMVVYIQDYYPNWCTYLINNKYPHIDWCWKGNSSMVETSKVKWCIIKDSISSFIFNTPYCYITLLLEK